VWSSIGRRHALFGEQVGVRSGSSQLKLVANDAVEQQPIRFHVKVAEALPVAFKRVVAVSSPEGLLLDEQG
jgi:hypothetical protein